MLNFFNSGGMGMWLFLALIIIIIVLSVKKIIDFLNYKNLNKFQLERGINSIVFWGAISLILGFLWHYIGLYNAMNIIIQAHDIAPDVVVGGYQESLITVLTGLNIFFISSLIWFIFRCLLKKIEALPRQNAPG